MAHSFPGLCLGSHVKKSKAMPLGTIIQCFMMNYLIFPNKVLALSAINRECVYIIPGASE